MTDTHKIEITDDDLRNRLKLIRCTLPPALLQSLLTQFHCAADIFNASSSQLKKMTVSDAQISRIQTLDENHIKRDLAWLEHKDHGILFYDQAPYPQQLREISDPPYALFYIGDIDYLQQTQLAMVGSRNPTASGSWHHHHQWFGKRH